MPLKPHPTDPDKMVYVSRQYDMPDTPTARAYLAKVLEDDDTQVYGDALTIAYQSGYYDGKKAALAGREWNFCERCGKRTADLTVIHTCTPPQEPWRESASDYERGFVDGMQKQMQSSVDKAVNAITQRPWVSLTDDQIKEIVGPWGDTPIKGYTRELIDKIEAKLRENNNG